MIEVIDKSEGAAPQRNPKLIAALSDALERAKRGEFQQGFVVMASDTMGYFQHSDMRYLTLLGLLEDAKLDIHAEQSRVVVDREMPADMDDPDME